VLLLVLAGTGSAQSDHKYEHEIDHTRRNTHQQLFASVERRPAARASFIY
jgi:hypothetical protein